ncbi:transcriptional regulator araC family protein [Streptomyces laurentii]|uniref:Transcriptional regulator araC family protein n=1 Tax=Streptomyces laurentii TaxID=39478 RepID=A0A169MXV9_STRLU|nr:transcriptional regulator araC family protein [Streptomyces laurentii]
MNRRQILRAGTVLGATGALAATAASPAFASESGSGSGREAGRSFRVHIAMFDGVEELDFTAPYEVFSAAGFFTPRPVEVRYVSATGARGVTGAYGMAVRGIRPWAPEEADLLVVPGGGYTRRDSPGVWAEIDRGILPRALAAAPRPGLTVAALCSGVVLLSAAGLTKGRPCTTHHKVKADLEQQGGLVKNARVVDDGDLVTAAGITSGLELALWLVRRELGADPAVNLEQMLEYEARGTVWSSSRGR